MSLGLVCSSSFGFTAVIFISLFNIHINKIESSIPDPLFINTCKYVDDCTLDESAIARFMQLVICKWLLKTAMRALSARNNMIMNPKKTKDIYMDLF